MYYMDLADTDAVCVDAGHRHTDHLSDTLCPAAVDQYRNHPHTKTRTIHTFKPE